MTGVLYGGVQGFCPRKNIIITTHGQGIWNGGSVP